MSEQVLTVRNSDNGKRVCIEGTAHALGLLGHLITELLKNPNDQVIRAVNPDSDVEIIVELHAVSGV